LRSPNASAGVERKALATQGLIPRLTATFVVVCLVAIHLVPAAAFQEAAVLVPPEYESLTPPPPGGSYEDPVFGTTIKRLTDATRIPIGGYVPVYSQHSAFNLDDTYLVLAHNSGGSLLLFDGNGTFLRLLDEAGVADEARWSRVNPHWLYYHAGNRIRRLDVATGQSVDIGAPFSGGITFGNGQGDVSDNERIVVVRSNRHVSIYDLENQRQLAEVDMSQAPLNGAPFDNAEVAKDGNSFIVNFSIAGVGRGRGSEQYDRDGNFMAQLLNAQGHASMGRDVDGTAVLFMTNAATNPQQPAGCDNGIVKISLDGDARRTCLMDIPWGTAKHISAHGNDGWAYVSTYVPGALPVAASPNDDNATDDTNWHTYTDEILRVRADASRIERLAHHRSSRESYWLQPHATISISGRKLIYGSDFMLDLHSEYADTYLIDLSAAVVASTPTALSPTGGITTRRPTYSWTRSSGADRYLLWVEGPLGSVHSSWYSALSVCSPTICSVSSPPVPELNLGSHLFGVSAANQAGESVTSPPMAFRVDFRNFRTNGEWGGVVPLK
jgi:hypothetical protein